MKTRRTATKPKRRVAADAKITGSEGYRELRKQVLSDFEADYVWNLLLVAQGNISQAARIARIDRKHLWRLIQRNGIKIRVEKTSD